MAERSYQYQAGECFLAYISFANTTGGKVRPVVLIHDKEENQFFVCTVTSQVDKPKNKKYGYVVVDWKEAGLDKPSIIKCNKDDMYLLKEPYQLIEKIGTLTHKDLSGLLVKQIKVRLLENEKQKQRRNDFEL